MVSRFIVTICVSKVGDRGTFCSGDLAISGILVFALVYHLRRRGCCNIFHPNRFKCEIGGGSFSTGSSCHLWLLMKMSTLLLVRHCHHCLVKSQRGCWFGCFFNGTATIVRAGSGYRLVMRCGILCGIWVLPFAFL